MLPQVTRLPYRTIPPVGRIALDRDGYDDFLNSPAEKCWMDRPISGRSPSVRVGVFFVPRQTVQWLQSP